jgi:hypothetical protein
LPLITDGYLYRSQQRLRGAGWEYRCVVLRRRRPVRHVQFFGRKQTMTDDDDLTPTPPATPPRSRRNRAIGVGALAVAVVAAGVGVFIATSSGSSPSSASSAAPSGPAVTTACATSGTDTTGTSPTGTGTSGTGATGTPLSGASTTASSTPGVKGPIVPMVGEATAGGTGSAAASGVAPATAAEPACDDAPVSSSAVGSTPGVAPSGALAAGATLPTPTGVKKLSIRNMSSQQIELFGMAGDQAFVGKGNLCTDCNPAPRVGDFIRPGDVFTFPMATWSEFTENDTTIVLHLNDMDGKWTGNSLQILLQISKYRGLPEIVLQKAVWVDGKPHAEIQSEEDQDWMNIRDLANTKIDVDLDQPNPTPADLTKIDQAKKLLALLQDSNSPYVEFKFTVNPNTGESRQGPTVPVGVMVKNNTKAAATYKVGQKYEASNSYAWGLEVGVKSGKLLEAFDAGVKVIKSGGLTQKVTYVDTDPLTIPAGDYGMMKASAGVNRYKGVMQFRVGNTTLVVQNAYIDDPDKTSSGNFYVYTGPNPTELKLQPAK